MTAATDGKNRTRPSTAIYRILMMEFERQRLALGISMAQVDDLAGTQDGYYAKMLYPDTPLGRQARWDTVQDVADALFGRGFSVQMMASEAVGVSAPTLEKGASANALKNRHWRHSKHYAEIGAKGGAARAKKLTKEQIVAIGKKGGIKWRRMCAARRKGQKHLADNQDKKNQARKAPHRLAVVPSGPNGRVVGGAAGG